MGVGDVDGTVVLVEPVVDVIRKPMRVTVYIQRLIRREIDEDLSDSHFKFENVLGGSIFIHIPLALRVNLLSIPVNG